MMQIHEKIKLARVSAGLTPEELATRIGIARTTYLYWETKTPGIEKIKSVAAALALPDNYFFVTPDEEFVKMQDALARKEKESLLDYTIQGGKKESKATANRNEWQDIFENSTSNPIASYERLIEQIEARRKDFESWAEKAEKDKERLYAIIEKHLTDLATNSKNIRETVSAIEIEMQAGQAAMMDTLDQVAKYPAGTTAAKAGSVELATHQELQKKGNNAGVGKQGKE